MKKILSTMLVGALIAGAAFADVSFSYTGSAILADNTKSFTKATRNDCLALELSNEIAGVHCDWDFNGGDAMAMDEYYAWMDFALPVGSLEITSGKWNGRNVNRVKTEAGDLGSDYYEVYKPGIALGGKQVADGSNLTDGNYATVLAYTLSDVLPGKLMFKAGIVDTTVAAITQVRADTKEMMLKGGMSEKDAKALAKALGFEEKGNTTTDALIAALTGSGIKNDGTKYKYSSKKDKDGDKSVTGEKLIAAVDSKINALAATKANGVPTSIRDYAYNPSGDVAFNAGFVGEVSYAQDDLIKATLSIKSMHEDNYTFGAYVSPLMVPGLDSMFGFTYLTTKDVMDAFGIDARAKYAITEKTSVTGMINYSSESLDGIDEDVSSLWTMLSLGYKAGENIRYVATVNNQVKDMDAKAGTACKLSLSPACMIKASEKCDVTVAFDMSWDNVKPFAGTGTVTLPIYVSFSL